MIACAYVPSTTANLAHDQDVLGDEAYQVVGSAPAEDTVSRARDRAATAGATKIETVVVQGKPADTLQQGRAASTTPTCSSSATAA